MKKILILSTSLRPRSNSEMLANAFAKGAAEAGNQVEVLSLRDKTIGFCRGCLTCQKTGKCVLQDDAVSIAEKVKEADVLVFATPVYYYEMSGQMKTLLDRCNPVFGTDYAFREVYLLATAADGDENAVEGTKNGLQGWLSCFGKAKLAGVVRGVGVTDPAEIRQYPALEQSAYWMGKRV